MRQWGRYRRERGLVARVKDKRGRAVGDGRALAPDQEKEQQKLYHG